MPASERRPYRRESEPLKKRGPCSLRWQLKPLCCVKPMDYRISVIELWAWNTISERAAAGE